MNTPSQPAPANLTAPRASRVRTLGLASVAWVLASIACATVAMATVPAAEWTPDFSGPVTLPAAVAPVKSQRVPVHEGVVPRFKASCQACGVVESIRKVEAAGAAPAAYEFTIRMRDGSTRVSSDATPARWSVGDSIMLIGGATPPINTQASL